MNDYYEVRVNASPCNEDTTDLLAAMLGDIGYESFVADVDGVSAYIKSELYDPKSLDAVLAEFPMECALDHHATMVEGQDWNQEWEKNYFKPILVGSGDYSVAIHSGFHHDIPKAKYDIVIDPRMAFGTGHHATTSLMIRALLRMQLAGKTVIDMGTGTGILAILAAMLGAKTVIGIEIDGFAYDNAIDNVESNGHPEIRLVHGDADALSQMPQCDLFLANINRNVITSDIAKYTSKMKDGAHMLLSGFYEHDLPVVKAASIACGLTPESHEVLGDNWCCLKLTKD